MTDAQKQADEGRCTKAAVDAAERPRGSAFLAVCIAEKSGIAADEIEPLLARIGTMIALTSTVDRCRVCGETKKVTSRCALD